jgi:hypothetical protein
VVEELPDETLVFDQTNSRAHCLNRAAREVWRACDGRTEVSTVVARLAKAGLPSDDSVVWLGVSRLEKARLLEDSTRAAAPKALTRREVVRALGLGGGLLFLLPAVDSIVAPLAAQAASCTPLALCASLGKNQCTGLPICGSTNQCCERQGQGCTSKFC